MNRLVGRIPVVVRGLAVFLAMLAGLLLPVLDRVRVLASGTEVVLKTRPVDPRDLFRGDYVRLGYEIGTLPKRLVPDGLVLAEGETVVLRLRLDPAGAEPLAVGRDLPPAGPGEALIRGRVLSSWSDDIRVAYGIETYFVPQGTGLAIERAPAADVVVVAAVGRDGQAVLKRLLVDGKPFADEPPY